MNSFSATAHAFTRHDGHSNLTSYSPRSTVPAAATAWGHCATQFQCARPRISVLSDAFACQKRISYIAMRVWVLARRRLSRLSVESLCLPACLVGCLCAAAVWLAKHMLSCWPKKPQNEMQTQRAQCAKQEEAKRSKGKAAGFAFAAVSASADAYASADCAAGVRLWNVTKIWLRTYRHINW